MPDPDADDWLTLKQAIVYIREKAGLSTGVSQVILHRVCSSGEVRSRQHFGIGIANPPRVIPIPANDWIGTTIDVVSEDRLYVNKLRDDYSDRYYEYIEINLPDLDWWLRNRSEPQGQAQQGTQGDTGDNSAGYVGTGAPGRPSSMHLVRGKFGERCINNEALPILAREAAWLEKWWTREKPPDAPPLRAGTIETGIRDAHRAWKRVYEQQGHKPPKK